MIIFHFFYLIIIFAADNEIIVFNYCISMNIFFRYFIFRDFFLFLAIIVKYKLLLIVYKDNKKVSLGAERL